MKYPLNHICETEGCMNLGKKMPTYRGRLCTSCSKGLFPEMRQSGVPISVESLAQLVSKICNVCKEEKLVSDFPRRKLRTGVAGFRGTCKECKSAQDLISQTRYRLKNDFNMPRSEVLKRKDRSLRRMYGIGLEGYQQMLVDQGNTCSLCPTESPSLEEMIQGRFWAVDHNHLCCSGKTACGSCNRGILCNPCNSALQSRWQDSEWRERALVYMHLGTPVSVDPE